MNIGVATARSQQCLKRMLDEPQDNLLKCKRACLAPPPPASGPPPFFKSTHMAAKPSPGQRPSRVGAYLLFEHCDKEDAYRAVHKDTQQQYTCQVLPLHDYLERLAGYSRVGEHDSVCRLQDVVVGQEAAYALLPSHYGDMHAYVRSRKRLGEEEARHFFGQMLSAVAHCHGRGVVLRDLKLRRFVFTDKHRTRLALLGLNGCVVLRGNHDDDSLMDRHGCPAYVGPELLTNGNRSYSGRAADVWSLGVSLYTMLVGRYPFQDTQPAALFAKIRRGVYSLPDWFSPQAKCLIACMLRKAPADRLTASELLMHPWLSSPCTPQLNLLKTQQQIPNMAALHGTHENQDQVVPTWSPKSQ